MSFLSNTNNLSLLKYEDYHHTSVKQLHYHQPTYEEIKKIEKYVKGLQSIVWTVYAIITIMLTFVFFIIAMENSNITVLLPVLAIDSILYFIFFLIRKNYDSPIEIAKGQLICYAMLQEAYVAIDSEKSIIKIGRRRNEAVIPNGEEVFILHLKAGYFLCASYEK